jgi:hypothetical protein
MAALEERVSYLEGAHEHLATKADIAAVKTDIATVKTDIAKLETRLIKWMIGLMVASIAVASTVALFIQRLIG